MKFVCLSLVLAMTVAMATGQADESLGDKYYNILNPAEKGFWLPPGTPIDSNTISGAAGGSPGAAGAASGTAAGSTPANKVSTGKCPPSRKVCPLALPTPKVCVFDSTCFGYQKCCYDRCHRRRVCKTKFFG